MRPGRPKVTVVMSVYNGERYVRDTIDSILNQTFKDFEFVIINDGSTDRTVQMINKYQDYRIRLIENKENIGLARSLNIGLNMAEGEYIARMDTGDISMQDRLKKQVSILDSDKRIGLVGTACAAVDTRGRELYRIYPPCSDADIRTRLPHTNCFIHSSVMFRRECIDTIGGYREIFDMAQDYDLWLRILEKYSVINIGEILHLWRLDMESATIGRREIQDIYMEFAKELASERRYLGKDRLYGKGEVSAREEFQRFFTKKISQRSDLNKLILKNGRIVNITGRIKAQSYYRWAYLFFSTGNYRAAIKFLLYSLWCDPFVLKRWKTLFIVLIGKRNVDLVKNLFGIKTHPYF